MRLINADALEPDADYDDGDYWAVSMAQIQNAPTIEERKTGKWIERNPQNSDKCRLIECDKCGFSHIVGFNVPYERWIENRNFCERCGANMRVENDYTIEVNGR